MKLTFEQAAKINNIIERINIQYPFIEDEEFLSIVDEELLDFAKNEIKPNPTLSEVRQMIVSAYMMRRN